MSFVSFAQNLEDVMLWRAFKGIENGFYIDVGANDPVIDSVTKSFYDRGWNGINIDPVLSHYNDLQRDRPLDINLCCAAGDAVGELELWECEIRGWATLDPAVISQHEEEGHRGAFYRVPVRTLSDICDEYVKGEIHFLKIDVEGFEHAVLRGMDFQRFRPWAVVVEATRPNSAEDDYVDWEHILLSSRYLFCYADGLNRFYVAAEHECLREFFKYPPNPFDNYTKFEFANCLEMLQATEQRARLAERRAINAEAELTEIYSSVPWRLMAPVRWVIKKLTK